MADDNPHVIPEMDPTLRKQIQECNLQIVNVTTPANFFHVLRRQVGTINLVFFLVTDNAEAQKSKVAFVVLRE